MKCRIVRGIDFIPAVHISTTQEGIDSRPQMLALMSGGMRSKERRLADVISVGRGAAGMIGWDEEVIETLLRRYYGILCVEYFVGGFFVVERGEVLLNFGAYYADGVGWTEVQIASDEGGDVGRDVVCGVCDEVAGGVRISSE